MDACHQLRSRVLQETEIFPLYKEKFPIQLLNFVRFSRIQDIGELAKVQFDNDVIISPQNEYEVLQIVMADLRERLQGYRENQVCSSPLHQQFCKGRDNCYSSFLCFCMLQKATVACMA